MKIYGGGSKEIRPLELLGYACESPFSICTYFLNIVSSSPFYVYDFPHKFVFLFVLCDQFFIIDVLGWLTDMLIKLSRNGVKISVKITKDPKRLAILTELLELALIQSLPVSSP